jgi:prolyl-tRNA editing enzyme YbaK/EbsC (Cys-tRNA(Pro) deacylase)
VTLIRYVEPVHSPRIGTLDWQPADDRPDLLAAPVAAALQRGQLDALVAPIDPDLADTAAFCAAYQVPLEVSANCVVVAGRRGDTSTMAACLVLATDRADINRVVRKHLDVRKISFADMATAVRETGMEYGGITPVGLPADWPVLVDQRVAAQPWVVVGSGIRGSKLLCTGSSTAGLPTAQVLALAQ